MKTALRTFILAIIVVSPIHVASAQLTSTSFRLYGDTIVGVGGRQTGSSYLLEGTGGDPGAGRSSSTNYAALSGFQELMEKPVFSFSLSTSELNLGVLTTGSVNTNALVLTTSTNADFGYVTTVTEDGDLRSGDETIADVADGTVTAGSEEYGISVAGEDAAFGDQEAITGSPLTVASRTTWKASAQVTVTHAAAISSSTSPGIYSHSVVYTSVGVF